MIELKAGSEDVRFSAHSDFYPKKMILKQGIRHFLLETRDIVYCYSNNKLVYIVDAANQKYVADKNLLRLAEELDPRMFFQANRNQIINFQFIRSFASHEKNKIKVELKAEPKDIAVIVSQTRVLAFKQWIYQQL